MAINPISGSSPVAGSSSASPGDQIVSDFGNYQQSHSAPGAVAGMSDPFDTDVMSQNSVPAPKMPDMTGGTMGKIMGGASDLKDNVTSGFGLWGDSADEKKQKEAEKFTTSMCKQACDMVQGEADKKAKEAMDQSMGVSSGGGNLA